jgi:hypothetical protein
VRKKTTVHRILILGALLAAVACASPVDETWLKITGITVIKPSGSESESSVLNTTLSDTEVRKVNIALSYQAARLGLTGADAVGCMVERVRVRYLLGNDSASLPIFDYGSTLYLSSATTTDKTTGETTSAGTGTVKGIPVVNEDLRAALRNNVPPSITGGPFSLTAEITVSGITDERKELSVTGHLTILFD